MSRREPTTNIVKKKRLLYLDLIRGTFLVFIIINHIPYGPKITDIITGDGALISSAAEGFFLLSGLMVAYLYLPKILSNTKSVLSKVWGRAGLLYVLSISTTLIFTLAALGLKTDPTGGALYGGNVLSIDFLQQLLSLQYIYGWADFLARYAIFMFFAPIALFLIAYKKTHILILLSLLVWFVSPAIGSEHFSAWQLLFFAGMIIGSKLDAIMSFFSNPKNKKITITVLTAAAVTAVWSLYVDLIYPAIISFHFNNSLFILLMDTFHIPYPLHDTLFSKEVMPLPRVFISLLWFLAALILFSRYKKTIKKYSSSFLSFLGQNSLSVYTIHSLIIFSVFILFTNTEARFGFVGSTVIGVGAVIFVYWLTKLYLTIKNKPKLSLEPIKTFFRR